MPFSLGTLELLILAAIAILGALLYVRGHRYCRACFASLACASLAALITPADVTSMVLLFIAFVGVFLLGVRYHSDPRMSAP